MVLCHAQEMHRKMGTALVKLFKTDTLHRNDLISCVNLLVEGLWSAWDPWGACLGTCDSDAKRNRTRSFTGGKIPCSGNPSEEGSCTGE